MRFFRHTQKEVPKPSDDALAALEAAKEATIREAESAVLEAQSRAREAAKRGRARDVAESLQHHTEQNHFAELVLQALRGPGK